MLKFGNISQANRNGLSFTVHGDGTSNVLHCNLSKQPFAIDFQGKLPSSMEVDCGDPDGEITGTASISLNESGDAIFALTYNIAPPQFVVTDGTTTVTMNIDFDYDSEG